MWAPYYSCGGWGLFPVIMIIGMFVVCFLLMRRVGSRGPWRMCGGFGRESRESENVLEILKKRYAKGEITKAEFEQMKMDVLS